MSKAYKFFVYVDGTPAPKFEHATLKEAKTETERLAGLQGMNNRTIRVLRQKESLTISQKLVTDKIWS